MKRDNETQMRHAATRIWPELVNGCAKKISRVRTSLQLLGYDSYLSYDAILQGWKKAGWIVRSPNGFEIKLTSQGNEQLARWGEEDRLWRSGSKQQMELPKRLKAGEPANNLRRIRDVIDNRIIQSIHDPYIDVKALENLLKLSELGVKTDTRLRLLGTPAKNMNVRTAAQFLCDDINIQNQSQWKMRTYTTKENPHRRFLVCADGSVVTCGLSLNNLNKDEVLDLIPASDDLAKYDCQFFEDKRKLGTALSFKKSSLRRASFGPKSLAKL